MPIYLLLVQQVVHVGNRVTCSGISDFKILLAKRQLEKLTQDPETVNNSVYSLLYHHKDRAAAKEQHSTLISVVTCRCYQIGHAIKISHRCFTANIASSIERFFFRGDLVFVTKGKICVPKQRAGSTHGNDIAHGVTTLRFGVRYSLFLLLQQNKTC